MKSKLEVKDKTLKYESEEVQKQLIKKHEEEKEEIMSSHKRELNAFKKDKESIAADLEQVWLSYLLQIFNYVGIKKVIKCKYKTEKGKNLYIWNVREASLFFKLKP